MSEKDLNLLMDLADQKLHQGVSKEEALRSPVNAGILDTNGNLTKSYQDLAVVTPQQFTYDIKPNLIIGFHGCEASVRDALLQNPNEIKISQKPFDWLGHTLYFWENNYERMLQQAHGKKNRGRIRELAVIGAALHLGHRCDLLDMRYIQLPSKYFNIIRALYKKIKNPIPEKRDIVHDPYKDKIMRHHDCTAAEFMHAEIFGQVQKDIKQRLQRL